MRRTQMRLGPGETTPVVRTLLIINGAVFFLQLFLRATSPSLSRWFERFFALIPVNVVYMGFIWQFVTYQFLHGGLLHILFNMFMLWMFGVELERIWGAAGFLRFYLLCGVAGGLGMVVFNYGDTPVVGASGAILGLLGAFALYWPDRMVYVWGILPVKIKHLVAVLAVISLLAGMSSGRAGIAHMAHLFGLLTGLFYAWAGDPRKPLLALLYNFFQQQKIKKKKREWKEEEKRKQEMVREADEILDKLNRTTWENLSHREKKRIKEISEELKGED